MKEFRCRKCRRLLGRYADCEFLEVKCPRCGAINNLKSDVDDKQAMRPGKKPERPQAALFL